MYKYLIVIISCLTSISIFVKSQTLSTLLPDSYFCLNYYENSDQCDSSVSQICYACDECYNDVNQLEEYSLMKSCDSDNIEIYTDSTCTSYVGILKDTCSSLHTDTSFILTSGNYFDLILLNNEINLAETCIINGKCNSGNEKECMNDIECSGLCFKLPGTSGFCTAGTAVTKSCKSSSDCTFTCACNPISTITPVTFLIEECFIALFFDLSILQCEGEVINIIKGICGNTCITLATGFSVIPFCNNSAIFFNLADCNPDGFLGVISPFPIPTCFVNSDLFQIEFQLAICSETTTFGKTTTLGKTTTQSQSQSQSQPSIPTPTPNKTINPSETTIPIDENNITTIIIIAKIVSICTILIVIVIIAIYFDNKKKIII